MKILTISIAAYNVEKYIHFCLKEIEKCKYLDLLEVFIVDDGGKDKTLTIAEEFVKRHPDVFIPVHKDNGGWGSTLNYSIEHSTAKYFKQLDGDDYFDVEGLNKLIECLINVDSDVIFTPYYQIDDKTSKIIKRVNFAEGFALNKEMTVDSIIGDLNLAMHMCTVKNCNLLNLRLLENCFYTDVEFIIKAIACSNTIRFIDEPVYCYRVARDGQSVSVSGFKKHYQEHEKVLMTMIEYTNSILNFKKKNAFYSRLRRMAGDQYVAYLCLDINADSKKKMLEYDARLKKYPEVYNTDLKMAKISRVFNGILYRVAATYVQKRK